MTEERDPKVSQRYRELGREEPPGELDAGILAASRRAAETRLAPLVPPTGRRRWYFPVAAAAIIALAVAVTLQVERQQPDAESITPPPQSTAESRTDALEAKRDSAPQAELRKAKPAEPPAASAPTRQRDQRNRPANQKRQPNPPVGVALLQTRRNQHKTRRLSPNPGCVPRPRHQHGCSGRSRRRTPPKPL